MVPEWARSEHPRLGKRTTPDVIRRGLFLEQKRVSTVSLPAAFSEEHYGQCQRHDPEILEQALPTKVFEVVVDLSANVIDADVVRLVDLRPSGDAWLHTLTHAVVRNVVAQACEDGGAFGPWTYDVHFAAKDVVELRQFVDSGPPQKAADRRNARVALLSPHRAPIDLGIHPHRPELVHLEEASAVVALPAVIKGSAALAAVEANACL